MSGCQNCSGNCESCSGCSGALVLTEGEIYLLRLLAQIPFLPVARKMDDMTPIFLEDSAFSVSEYSLILQCLEKKNLITLDVDQPLGAYENDGYAPYSVHGSMALTARGQDVLELLELQGIDS